MGPGAHCPRGGQGGEIGCRGQGCLVLFDLEQTGFSTRRFFLLGISSTPTESITTTERLIFVEEFFEGESDLDSRHLVTS